MAQSDEDGLSLAPKDVAKDSRPLLGTVNGQLPGKRNPKLTKFDKNKWKIEGACRRGEQTSEADKRAPSEIFLLYATLRDRWFVVLSSSVRVK